MIKLKKPNYTATEIFETCVKNMSSLGNVSTCIPIIKRETEEYNIKVSINESYLLKRNNYITSNVGKIEMKKVYERMRDKKYEGRKYYDNIKLSVPNNKCPYCSIRKVNGIDHYLPQVLYPIYTVSPNNLIPSCYECNNIKKTYYPFSQVDALLHPYFDDLEGIKWIKAKILKTNPVSISYYAEPPNTLCTKLQERLKNHFKIFGINDIYISRGIDSLVGHLKLLKKLHIQNKDILKNHLYEMYESHLELGINSAEAVLYLALYQDDWFCETGITYENR